MKRKVVFLTILFMLLCLLSEGAAQVPVTTFQQSKEDFSKALRQRPTLEPKGLENKGPKKVVPDDYAKLVENPLARSLILFDFNSDVIKRESYPILQNLAEVLREELKEILLVVAGHTDSIGADEYNLDLSRRRAQAVKGFLVSAHGIAAERLIIQAYGKSQPIASNDTEQGRAMNRRVEFIRVR